MAREFGVTDGVYCKALAEIRKTRIPDEYWKAVGKMMDEEAKKSADAIKAQQVDDELLHRRFTL